MCVYIYIAVSRPTIKQLKRYVVPKVAHKWQWYNLGLELLDDGEEARSLNLYTGGNQKCCSEMLRDWLNRNPKADWYQLVAALESPAVQLNIVAGDIRNMFTGTYIRTWNVLIACDHFRNPSYIRFRFRFINRHWATNFEILCKR